MSNKITIKRSAVVGKVPTSGDLDYGEIAINYTDGNLFYKNSSNAVTTIASTQFVSVTGNVTGSELWSTQSIGNEGGQLNLAKAAANTTLEGNSLTIDVYQNRVRIFEQGGNNRGAYIDITSCANGVGTNLLAGGGLTWTTQANTAPSGPSAGDFWYNSATGIKYQYVNDGTSSQWVDQSFPSTFASLSVTGNIVSGNVSVTTGTITLGSIVNGGANGVGNIGTPTTYFNTVHAKATSAQYADLAELYLGDREYLPGTLVDFGGSAEITATTQSHSTKVAGVISKDPSYLMNSGLKGGLPVALTGRVMCSVVGVIRKGDRLVSSEITGVATSLEMLKYQPGCIIGKALADYNSDKVGQIEIAVGRY